MVRQICVVGAGIIGCSTAVYLQQTIQNIEITIISESFSPNLTSDVAAGHIEPYVSPPKQQQFVVKWTKETIDYIKRFMKEHPNCGAQEYSGYLFQKDVTTPPFWAEIMPNFRQLSPDEVKERHPLPQSAGFFFSSLYLEPTKHLDHLIKTFLSNGGKCRTQKLTSLSDVGESFDVVVNCTGLGSRFLLGDKELIPVRGQIIRVYAPFVKHFFVDDDYYALLNDDCLILGGTREYNQWDLTVDPETAERILKGNEERIPSLKNVKVLSHHVGLRPFRSSVRIEVEQTNIGRRKVPVVHNYGHGGSGVTIFWGCAKEAAQLVEEVLARSKI